MAPFCTLSSQHASQIFCTWKMLVNSLLGFCLLLSFLQKDSIFTYCFETGLRKQWPAQPSSSFSEASVFKDESTCRRIFLGSCCGWCYRLGTESVFTHLMTVTFSLTTFVSTFSSQVFAIIVQDEKSIWIKSFWQQRAISGGLKVPFYTFSF